jgi:hypothetical protein
MNPELYMDSARFKDAYMHQTLAKINPKIPSKTLLCPSFNLPHKPARFGLPQTVFQHGCDLHPGPGGG